MRLIDEIVERRRKDKNYDTELWDFVAQMQGHVLKNATDQGLQTRLEQLERNIQFLDVGTSDRDRLAPEHGWLSPWWWLRLRHWTLSEIMRRSLVAKETQAIDPMPVVHPDFNGIHAGEQLKLFRISRESFLLDTLHKGRIRFAPAHYYKEIEDDEARTDDEMTKAYKRPGHQITITTENGKKIEPIGDVTFSTSRNSSGQPTDAPYWLTCFSTDLDPRLIADFSSNCGDDAVLAIFDVKTLLRRSLPTLKKVAPLSSKELIQVEYFDMYHPPHDQISPVNMKDMRFAYQREFRLVLDPGNDETLGADMPFFIEIGSLADIAAVYSPVGNRIAGTGPDRFLL